MVRDLIRRKKMNLKNFPKNLNSKTSCLRITVPENLDLALEGLIRKVLKEQPKTDDIYSFAANYFETLIKFRDKAGIKYMAGQICPFHNDEDAHDMIKLANNFPKPPVQKINVSRKSTAKSKKDTTKTKEPSGKVVTKNSTAKAVPKKNASEKSKKLASRVTPTSGPELEAEKSNIEKLKSPSIGASENLIKVSIEENPLDDEIEFLKSDPIKTLVEKELMGQEGKQNKKERENVSEFNETNATQEMGGEEQNKEISSGEANLNQLDAVKDSEKLDKLEANEIVDKAETENDKLLVERSNETVEKPMEMKDNKKVEPIIETQKIEAILNEERKRIQGDLGEEGKNKVDKNSKEISIVANEVESLSAADAYEEKESDVIKSINATEPFLEPTKEPQENENFPEVPQKGLNENVSEVVTKESEVEQNEKFQGIKQPRKESNETLSESDTAKITTENLADNSKTSEQVLSKAVELRGEVDKTENGQIKSEIEQEKNTNEVDAKVTEQKNENLGTGEQIIENLKKASEVELTKEKELKKVKSEESIPPPKYESKKDEEKTDIKQIAVETESNTNNKVEALDEIKTSEKEIEITERTTEEKEVKIEEAKKKEMEKEIPKLNTEEAEKEDVITNSKTGKAEKIKELETDTEMIKSKDEEKLNAELLKSEAKELIQKAVKSDKEIQNNEEKEAEIKGRITEEKEEKIEETKTERVEKETENEGIKTERLEKELEKSKSETIKPVEIDEKEKSLEETRVEEIKEKNVGTDKTEVEKIVKELEKAELETTKTVEKDETEEGLAEQKVVEAEEKNAETEKPEIERTRKELENLESGTTKTVEKDELEKGLEETKVEKTKEENVGTEKTEVEQTKTELEKSEGKEVKSDEKEKSLEEAKVEDSKEKIVETEKIKTEEKENDELKAIEEKVISTSKTEEERKYAELNIKEEDELNETKTEEKEIDKLKATMIEGSEEKSVDRKNEETPAERKEDEKTVVPSNVQNSEQNVKMKEESTEVVEDKSQVVVDTATKSPVDDKGDVQEKQSEEMESKNLDKTQEKKGTVDSVGKLESIGDRKDSTEETSKEEDLEGQNSVEKEKQEEIPVENEKVQLKLPEGSNSTSAVEENKTEKIPKASVELPETVETKIVNNLADKNETEREKEVEIESNKLAKVEEEIENGKTDEKRETESDTEIKDEEELCTVVDKFNIIRVDEVEKLIPEERQIKTITTHLYDFLQVPQTITKEYKVHHTVDNFPNDNQPSKRQLPEIADTPSEIPPEVPPETQDSSLDAHPSETDDISDITTPTSNYSLNLSELSWITISEMFLESERQYSSRELQPTVSPPAETNGRKEVEEIIQKTVLPTGIRAVPIKPRDDNEINEENAEVVETKKDEDQPESSSSEESNEPITETSGSKNGKSIDSDTPVISVEVKTVIETQILDEENGGNDSIQVAKVNLTEDTPEVEVRVETTISVSEEPKPEAGRDLTEAATVIQEEYKKFEAAGTSNQKTEEEDQKLSSEDSQKDAEDTRTTSHGSLTLDQSTGKEGSSGESDSTASSAVTEIKRYDSGKRNFTRSSTQKLLTTQSLDSIKRNPLLKTRSLSTFRQGVTDFEVWSTIEKELEKAATTIQSKFRGYNTRKKLRRENAVQITTEESSVSTTPVEQEPKEHQQNTGEFHDSIVLSIHPR